MTAPTMHGKEIISWSLVSALMQVGWKLFLVTAYAWGRGSQAMQAREVWQLVSPDLGDGKPTITRPVVMRSIERMRKAGRIVPGPEGTDEWVLARPKRRST